MSDTATVAPAVPSDRAEGRDAAVSIRNLVKEFTDARSRSVVRAVDDISIDIRDGEFFALLGPSGCGKTTTLRAIGGFDEPTSGEILLRGKPMRGIPPSTGRSTRCSRRTRCSRT